MGCNCLIPLLLLGFLIKLESFYLSLQVLNSLVFETVSVISY